MLLEQLLKYTDPAHPDYVPLSNALHMVEVAASHINESVRASENRKIIADIQDKFENVTFVAPHRLFITAVI